MIYFQRMHEEEHIAAALKNPKAKEWLEKLLLGRSIKKLRRSQNLTQKHFAAKLKTSQSVVARIELGKQNLTIQMLIRIAHILGKKIQIKIL